LQLLQQQATAESDELRKKSDQGSLRLMEAQISSKNELIEAQKSFRSELKDAIYTSQNDAKEERKSNEVFKNSVIDTLLVRFHYYHLNNLLSNKRLNPFYDYYL